MLLKFRCPSCHGNFRVTDEHVRQYVICSHCGQKLHLPKREPSQDHAKALEAKAGYAAGFNYTVAFKPAPTRTAAAAIKFASSNPTHATPADGENLHRVSYKPWGAAAVLELVSLLSGMEVKTFFNELEVPFEDMRTSLACLRIRYSSNNPELYCRGGVKGEDVVFLCHKCGIGISDFEPWIYSHTFLGDDGRFHIDVPSFLGMAAQRLHEYRYCPFACGAFLEKAVSRFEERFELGVTPYAKFLRAEAHTDIVGRRVKNRTGAELYQRVCTFTETCLRCAIYHGLVHDGTGRVVPLPPVHDRCSCVDIAVPPGQESRGYRDFGAVLQLLPENEQESLVGKELAELVRIGLPVSDILRGSSLRTLHELAPRLNTLALEELNTSREVLQALRALKGEKRLKRDEKEWARLVSRQKRGCADEAEARKLAAQALVSKSTGHAT